MTTHNLNGPAFPQVGETSGMSRLDYFAGLAMQGDLAGGAHVEDNARYAKWCYDLAEAMLAESERRAT